MITATFNTIEIEKTFTQTQQKAKCLVLGDSNK